MCQPDQAVWEGSSPKPIPIHPLDERYEVTRLLKPEYHARPGSGREERGILSWSGILNIHRASLHHTYYRIREDGPSRLAIRCLKS